MEIDPRKEKFDLIKATYQTSGCDISPARTGREIIQNARIEFPPMKFRAFREGAKIDAIVKFYC